MFLQQNADYIPNIGFVPMDLKKLYKLKQSESNLISLLECDFKFIFENMPKEFIISTNTGSYKFNTDILKSSSSVISRFLKNNPTNYRYHLDINDECNVLSKIEQLLRGESIFLLDEEISTFKQIISNLQFWNFSFSVQTLSYLKHAYTMNFRSFEVFLQKYKLKHFTISTKNNEYKCSIFGVLSSKVICEYMNKNPTKNDYFYEIDDEFNEFQKICDLFNFKKVQITPDDMNCLRNISEELRIECIYDKIDKYTETYDNFSNRIDDEQSLVEQNEQLFEYLSEVKEKGVSSVSKYILESTFVKSEDEVREIAGIVLQIVKNNFLLHREMSELVFQLEQESNEKNQFHIFAPFIVNKLLDNFGTDKHDISFIYNLYRRGMISREEIIDSLKKYNNKNSNSIYYCENIIYWFFPEIIQISDEKDFFYKLNSSNQSFFKKYLNDIDKYTEMLDLGEPTDEITKALRHDDVDSLQALVANSRINISKATVPYNIFEDVVNNGTTKYINYAAAYGSIKCFKYLLLNHAEIDDYSFKYAISGGNIEIIKIVDQNKKKDKKTDDNDHHQNRGELSLIVKKKCDCEDIVLSIKKHRNDLFDWLLESKYYSKKNDQNFLEELALISAENGNAHSLISIIETRSNLTSNIQIQKKIFELAARNGFYRILQIVYNILFKNSLRINFDSSSFVEFGNLKIYKLFLKIATDSSLVDSLVHVVQKENVDMLNCFFDNENINKLKFTTNGISSAFVASAKKKSSQFFFYLYEQIERISPNVYDDLSWNDEILPAACLHGNIEIVKKILDCLLNQQKNSESKYKFGLQLNKSIKTDFTQDLINAALSGSLEICQLLVDKKLKIDFKSISLYRNLSVVNAEIFSFLLENSPPKMQPNFLHKFLYESISSKNKELLDFILKELKNRNEEINEDILIKGSNSKDVEIVKIILKYKNDPKFVNIVSSEGTALCIAVKNNSLPMVQCLLSVPGIDISLYDNNDHSPLQIAFNKDNIDIMNALIDAYCNDNVRADLLDLNEMSKRALERFIKCMLDKSNLIKDYLCFSCVNNNLNNSTKKDEEKEKCLSIVSKLLDIKDINPNYIMMHNTFLSMACSSNLIEIAQKLLKLDKIDPNKYNPSTLQTPLMIALSNYNIGIAELLIKHPRTDINFTNINHESALSIAVSNRLEKIVKLIINDDKFDEKGKGVNYAFYISDEYYTKLLISLKSIDVNKTFQIERETKSQSINVLSFQKAELPSTKLMQAVESNDLELVNLIIHHNSFDIDKSNVEKVLVNSMLNNYKDITKTLLHLLQEVINDLRFVDKNILIYMIDVNNNEMLNELLNNEDLNFNEKCISDTFYHLFIDGKKDIINMMTVLNDYAKKHGFNIDLNETLQNGKTLLTSLSSFLSNVERVASFLLENGADPNLPNKEGVYPLEYAILNKMEGLIHVLIESNQIDYSIRIKSKTYLHLAARVSNVKLLKELLDKKLIDINSTDDLGETPLMEAVRAGNKNFVIELFKMDGLDYLHCNNKGEDSLKIIENIYNKDEENIKITDKDQYLEKLLQKMSPVFSTSNLKLEFGKYYANPFEKIVKSNLSISNSSNGNSSPNITSVVALNSSNQGKSTKSFQLNPIDLNPAESSNAFSANTGQNKLNLNSSSAQSPKFDFGKVDLQPANITFNWNSSRKKFYNKDTNAFTLNSSNQEKSTKSFQMNPINPNQAESSNAGQNKLSLNGSSAQSPKLDFGKVNFQSAGIAYNMNSSGNKSSSEHASPKVINFASQYSSIKNDQLNSNIFNTGKKQSIQDDASELHPKLNFGKYSLQTADMTTKLNLSDNKSSNENANENANASISNTEAINSLNQEQITSASQSNHSKANQVALTDPNLDNSSNLNLDNSSNPNIDNSSNPNIDNSSNPNIDNSSNPNLDNSSNPNL